MALGAIPARHPAPPGRLARVGPVVGEGTAAVRMIGTFRQACILPGSGFNVLLAGEADWTQKLHRPWPGGCSPRGPTPPSRRSANQRTGAAVPAATSTPGPSRGVVDESCGPAPALRAAWTARGQRLSVADRLTTLARLSPTNPTGPTAKMASLKKTVLAQDPSQPVQRPTHRHGTPNEPVRIIPASQENRLQKNARKNGDLLTE